MGAQGWRAAGEKQVCWGVCLPSLFGSVSGPVPLVWSPCPSVFLRTSSSFPSPTPLSSGAISPPSLPSTPSHLPLPLLSHQFLPLSSSTSLFHPPSPNSASLCLSDLSSLPSLSFLLLRGGCDHRNISEEEEGAELGEADRGAAPRAWQPWLLLGTRWPGAATTGCRSLWTRLVRGSNPASFPSLLMTLDQSFSSCCPRGNATYHMRLFEESVR